MSVKKSEEIREFILEQLDEDPLPVTRIVLEKFGISRQAVNKHLRKLQEEGLIESKGETFGRQYFLRERVSEIFKLNLEDEIIKGALITHQGQVVNEMVKK